MTRIPIGSAPAPVRSLWARRLVAELIEHDPEGAQRALSASAVPGCPVLTKRPPPVCVPFSPVPKSPKLDSPSRKPRPLSAQAAKAEGDPRGRALALAEAVGKSSAQQPPPKGPRLIPTHVGYTHPGGSKPLDAVNQDTWFHLCIDDHNAVWGVFDGHGGENGALVAQVAADTVKAHLAAHFVKLRTEPEAVCIAAFELAHEAARRAVLASNTSLKARPPTVTNPTLRPPLAHSSPYPMGRCVRTCQSTSGRTRRGRTWMRRTAAPRPP